MMWTEKQQKYQDYHLEKLINKNILQVKKYCHLINLQPTLKYSHLGKALEKQRKTIEKQGKKQVLKPNSQKLTIKDAIS